MEHAVHAVMAESTGDERRILERTATLHAGALGDIAPTETISPRTLALRARAAAGLADTALAPPPSTTRTAQLPRISLDFRPPASSSDGAHRAAPSADFTVLRTLGEGGMGRVHLAVQRSLEREVAIKTVKEGAASAVRDALLHEARITGALEHPGIIPVHALGLDDHARPLLVMKRIEGSSLRALLDDRAHPGWAALSLSSSHADQLTACIDVLIRVCQSLAFAHSRGFLHRDVKPDNIMVGAYGEVYLLDWGVAATLEEASIPGAALVGTPVYMAPEMALGDVMDARTDVYLLGAVLHEVLTGRFRHEGDGLVEVFRAASTSAPVAYGPGVPADLADLCNRATARDPAKRPADAEAFRRELASHLRTHAAAALCTAALERTAGLRDLLAAAPEGAPPADLAAAYRLAAEARFGFAQSLREAPTHERSKAGLTACILLQVDLELRQRHAETAGALLADLDAPPPGLLARIDDVRREAESARRDAERMKEIARDHDPSISAGTRTFAIVASLTVVTIATIRFVVAPGGLEGITAARSVWPAVALVAVNLLTMAALRRRLLSTLFNRRSSLLALVGCGATLLNRVFGLVDGKPLWMTFADDMSLLTLLFTVGAAVFERGFWMPAAAFALGRLAITFRPDRTLLIVSVATIAGLSLCVLAIQRGARLSESQRPAPSDA